jgi:Na+-translocating ferredoxin:NAD+ oxidoreductase RnfA subunit
LLVYFKYSTIYTPLTLTYLKNIVLVLVVIIIIELIELIVYLEEV